MTPDTRQPPLGSHWSRAGVGTEPAYHHGHAGRDALRTPAVVVGAPNPETNHMSKTPFAEGDLSSRRHSQWLPDARTWSAAAASMPREPGHRMTPDTRHELNGAHRPVAGVGLQPAHHHGQTQSAAHTILVVVVGAPNPGTDQRSRDTQVHPLGSGPNTRPGHDQNAPQPFFAGFGPIVSPPQPPGWRRPHSARCGGEHSETAAA